MSILTPNSTISSGWRRGRRWGCRCPQEPCLTQYNANQWKLWFLQLEGKEKDNPCHGIPSLSYSAWSFSHNFSHLFLLTFLPIVKYYYTDATEQCFWDVDEFFLFVTTFLSWPFFLLSIIRLLCVNCLGEGCGNKEQRKEPFQKPTPFGNGSHSSLRVGLSNRSHYLQLTANPPTRKMFPRLEEGGVRKETMSIDDGDPLAKVALCPLPGHLSR